MNQSKQTPSAAPETWGCKTDDLLTIHGVFRHGLGKAADLIRGAKPADRERVEFVSNHLKELLQALHNHHQHEDILWWDRLKQRAPESTPVVERMISAHEQVALLIEEVQGKLAQWVKSPQDKEELLSRLAHLNEVLFTHLKDEETHIMPLAAKVLTQKEWDDAHSIGMNEILKNRMLVQLGYLLQCSPTPQLRQEVLDSLPGFVKLLYRLNGKKKFEKEWEKLYGEKPR